METVEILIQGRQGASKQLMARAAAETFINTQPEGLVCTEISMHKGRLDIPRTEGVLILDGLYSQCDLDRARREVYLLTVTPELVIYVVEPMERRVR